MIVRHEGEIEHVLIGSPYSLSRESVLDPIDPTIRIPTMARGVAPERLYGVLVMTVPQAIEMASELLKEIGDFCRRSDIRQALTRTDANSVCP